MNYSPPNSDETKNITFIYFIILFVVVIAINAAAAFSSGERMSDTGKAVKIAISDKRFDIANTILDIYDGHISEGDVDYSLLMKNFDVESHVNDVLSSYSPSESEKYEAYKLLYILTKKEKYKKQMGDISKKTLK